MAKIGPQEELWASTDAANFLSPLLSWDEVVEIAEREGFTKGSRNPGEIARYLAFRLHQHKPRVTLNQNRDYMDAKQRFK